MSQFIMKDELTKLFEDVIRFNLAPDITQQGKTPAEIAQMTFEGKIDIDVYKMGVQVERAKEAQKRREECASRRGGLGHDELRDKILEGIVNGALRIHHGQIAPYQYGFEVTFGETRASCQHRWECYCKLEDVPERIVGKIEHGKQDREVFSSKALKPVDVTALLEEIENKEQTKITSFVPHAEAGLEPRRMYSGHVASLDDVHNGVALDGVIRGLYRGDYSTITTNTQNETVRTLVAMKGFCLDALGTLPSESRALAVSFLKEHGTDVSTPEKLQDWIRRNPEKCALPENRNQVQALDSVIKGAKEQAAEKNQGRSGKHHDTNIVR